MTSFLDLGKLCIMIANFNWYPLACFQNMAHIQKKKIERKNLNSMLGWRQATDKCGEADREKP